MAKKPLDNRLLAADELPKWRHEHATSAALLAGFFDSIAVGVTLFDSHGWSAIHQVPNVLDFELEHGRENPRIGYNERCLAEVRRRKQTVLGQYVGFSDLFVPVIKREQVVGILATGPFSRSPPTSRQIQARWQLLTGHLGHLADAEFAHYVSATLSTLMLDRSRLAAYREMLGCFAALLAEEGDPLALMTRARRLREKLSEATFANRMWDAGSAMIDPSTARIWASQQRRWRLEALGVRRLPEHALVGLIAGVEDEADSLEQLIRRHAFQRACVRLARSVGDAISGRVGDYGVTFLLPSERSDSRTRTRVVSVVDRAKALAKKLRFRLHVGTSLETPSALLPKRYHAALAAAESTLVKEGTASSDRPTALREVRRRLAELVNEAPTNMLARFNRYLELVAAHSGYRSEVAEVELQAGFERLAEPFVTSGALGQKSLDDLYLGLEQETEGARKLGDAFDAYRRAVSDLERMLKDPTRAHQERNLRRAIVYVREHLNEPLAVARVARIAGFAPNYFSRLFKARERVSFAQFVIRLRIERAKQLLDRTRLSAARVSRLSGFSSNQYFHNVFRRATSQTPLEYRERSRLGAGGSEPRGSFRALKDRKNTRA